MNKKDRLDWLAAEIEKSNTGIDILDADFCDKYIEKTGVPFQPTMWGAHKCQQLGRDLSELAATGRAKRFRIGLSGAWQPGFPTWIWSYTKSREN